MSIDFEVIGHILMNGANSSNAYQWSNSNPNNSNIVSHYAAVAVHKTELATCVITWVAMASGRIC